MSTHPSQIRRPSAPLASTQPPTIHRGSISAAATMDRLATAVIYAGATLVVAIVGLIFYFLLRESAPFFEQRSLWSLLRGEKWYPLEPDEAFGALPLIGGTTLTTLIAVLLALPVGLLCATFLGEIAGGRTQALLKSVVELLAGVPSVVIGFVGMALLAPWMRETLKLNTGLTALTGGALLSLMALPTIISISEDALHAVPRDYRLGSLALGATPLQTIWRITVPSARRGILAALMLGVGRAIGETMTVLMTTGNAASLPSKLMAPVADNSVLQSVRTLTATIAAEMGETAQGTIHYHALFALGVVLFVITFMVNTLADIAISSGRRS